MKNKIFASIILCLAFVLLFSIVPCSAANEDEMQSVIPEIISYHGYDSIQSFIDGYLTQNAGVASEWYVLALSQYGDFDFSSYEASLIDYINNQSIGSASTRLKFALCLAAVKSTSGYILKTLNDSIGEQGLMSFIFGLHLLNNGYESEKYSITDIRSKLLSMQCEDGGWSITGQKGDPDSTAMTIQALAPYYGTDSAVKAACDKAVSLLSELQLESGEFSSFGNANPESAAQVIISLSSLGLDAKSDERFIKNGNGLFDGIEKYRLENGAFCHLAGGEANDAAMSQVFCAAVSYLRFIGGNAPLYSLDNSDPENAEPAWSDTKAPEDAKDDKAPGINYKIWVSLSLIAIGFVACLLLFVFKKRHIKNFIAVLLLCAATVAFVCLTDFRSADDYYSGGDVIKENAVGTVTLSIRCDSVAGRAEHIPENGVVLDVSEFPIAEGDTVYTVLTDAAKKHKIQIENNGTSTLAYISGINYLYEFDFGELSGWEYRVNGERPSVGASEYRPKDGDMIEWYYTLTLGK